MICFLLPNERIPEIARLLRQVFALDPFRTRASRMGKILQVKRDRIEYYLVSERAVYSLPFTGN